MYDDFLWGKCDGGGTEDARNGWGYMGACGLEQGKGSDGRERCGLESTLEDRGIERSKLSLIYTRIKTQSAILRCQLKKCMKY